MKLLVHSVARFRLFVEHVGVQINSFTALFSLALLFFGGGGCEIEQSTKESRKVLRCW